MPITLNHDGDIAVTNGSITVDGSPIGGSGSTGPTGPAGATGPSGGGGGGLSGTNYIYVAADGTDTENATELQAAYNTAKTLSPTSTNRITIIAAPGLYNFGASTNFVMDTEYIDLVSLDGNRSVIFNYTDSMFTGTGTISITANDVFVKGVDVQDKNFTIATNLNLLRVENCKGGNFSFGGDVTAGSNRITVSGTFTDCTGGFRSFGGGGGTASGTFTNCTGGSYGSFAERGIASGTFTGCTAGESSFGSNSGTASGTFTGCTAGESSFGSSYTASGTFTNCTGGYYSFGGEPSGTLTGKLFYCRLTSGTFQTVSEGGITRLCIDGNNAENNQG